MVNALWISLIGMGLVFLSILLLWGLMVLLVRLTAERAPVDAQAPIHVQEIPALSEPDGAVEVDRKRRAAAAAVAVALALKQRAGMGRGPDRPEPVISSWQAVHRASLLAQRANPPRKR